MTKISKKHTSLHLFPFLHISIFIIVRIADLQRKILLFFIYQNWKPGECGGVIPSARGRE